MTKHDPELFPCGYKGERREGPSFYKCETSFGWEVRRAYIGYDDRPYDEIVAVRQGARAGARPQRRCLFEQAGRTDLCDGIMSAVKPRE